MLSRLALARETSTFFLVDTTAENLRRVQEDAHIKRPFCKHKLSCSQNAIQGFLRSGAIFFAAKYAMGFLPSLLSGQILRDPRLLLKLAGKDTIGFSVFMSAFSTSFKAVLCGLRRYRGSNDWKNAFAAGLVAGTTIVCTLFSI